MMDVVLTWLAEYWWAVLLAVSAVMKVLNTITKHFSESKGLVKWCLFIIDLMDIVKSTPAPKVKS